jgi:hypothetical protein
MSAALKQDQALRHEEVTAMGREMLEVSWRRRPIAYRKLIYGK